MFRNSSCGTYLPMTTMHTVRGVASSSPGVPQSHVQNTADTRIATVETPVCAPYSHGSMMLFDSSSITTNMMITVSGTAMPWYTASDSVIGNAAPIQGPMYGINRSTAVSRPHKNQFGNGGSFLPMKYPIAQSP